jgi:hypothetical protein
MDNETFSDLDDDRPLDEVLKNSTRTESGTPPRKPIRKSKKNRSVPASASIPLRPGSLKQDPSLAGTEALEQEPASVSKNAESGAGENGASDKAVRASNSPAKKYALPGQRRDPPPENDPLRIFYTTMREEKLRKYGRSSVLADEWLMVHGLLDEETARSVLDARRKRQMEVLRQTPWIRNGMDEVVSRIFHEVPELTPVDVNQHE